MAIVYSFLLMRVKLKGVLKSSFRAFLCIKIFIVSLSIEKCILSIKS